MSWRPSLRIAARESRRAKARSVLIVSMIALPVVALSFADVMWRTAVAGPEEQLSRDVGASEAALFMSGGAGDGLVQAADPRPWNWTMTGDGSGIAGGIHDLTLPPGTRMLVEDQRSVDAVTRGGTASLGWTEVDAADPAFAGRWILDEGRYASGPGEVALTPAMADRTGLAVGGTFETVRPAGTYTVVGIASRAGDRELRSAVALPGTLVGAPDGLPAASVYTQEQRGFLVGAPVSWEDVRALNKQGAVVVSRAVIADPPATTPYDELAGGSSSLSDYLVPVLIVAMVVGLSGLIVVLLAGTAFAVGARRQARSLAVVAAGGGSRRDLRRVVLSGGLVLGVAAGLVGILVGVTLAFVLDRLIWHFNWIPDVDLAGFDVRPLELVPIGLVGVITGVLAALVPARQAARLDVVAALRGRSGAGRRSRHTPIVGVAMVAVGVVLTILGSGWVVAARDNSIASQNLLVAVLVGGAALVLLGLVTCAGAVVSLVSRIAPRLPLAGRLALRDADRHRGRTAPAVAAVLAAVSGSVAVMLYVASLDQQDRDRYTAASPPGTSTVSLTQYDTDPETGTETLSSLDPDRVLHALTSAVSVADSVVVRSTADCAEICATVSVVRPKANRCPIYDEEPWDSEGAAAANTPGSVTVAEDVPDDPRCNGPATTFWATPRLAVGGTELLAASGHPAGGPATKVLAEGGVVVTDPLDLDVDGTVRLKYYGASTAAQQPPPGQENTWTGPVPDKVVRVPAVYVPPEQAVAATVVSPSALKGMDLDIRPTTLLVRTGEPVTQDQEDAVNAALAASVGTGATVQVERGYESTYGLGLLALAIAAGVVTLGATGIATGLALTDARADHATLAAVGAAPRLRRRLAAAQSLLLGFLGVLLGIAAGVVPALSIIGASASLTVVWPWPQLVALVIGIPLLAGGFAYVFTRSRVPMQRRVVA